MLSMSKEKFMIFLFKIHHFSDEPSLSKAFLIRLQTFNKLSLTIKLTMLIR